MNYNAVEAVVTLTDAKGAATTLRPQRRFFSKSAESSSEVDIRSDLRRDLYLVLAGWEDGGNVTAIEAIVNPLVDWIDSRGALTKTAGPSCSAVKQGDSSGLGPAPARISGRRRLRSGHRGNFMGIMLL